MKKQLNLLGLSFEIGQERKGLSYSYDFFKQYLSKWNSVRFEIIDRGEIIAVDKNPIKVNSSESIELFDWSSYQKAYRKICHLLDEEETLLNWGGDHSVALSTVGAFCTKYPQGNVLWIDAHANLNLPHHSLTGNLHGMPLSVLLNLQNIQTDCFQWIQSQLRPENLIYLGLRDLDPFEQEMLHELQIVNYSAQDVKERGITSIALEISKRLTAQPLHISFDIDSVNPEYAPSTGIAVPEGLNPSDLHVLAQALHEHKNIKSMDVVEINPCLGTGPQILQTYDVAMGFMKGLFNQTQQADLLFLRYQL